MKSKPNPGSDAALDAGCLCPVLDNSHGYGYMGQKGVFCINSACPMHGLKTARKGRKKGKK